jgi:protein-disulfide isomerase
MPLRRRQLVSTAAVMAVPVLAPRLVRAQPAPATGAGAGANPEAPPATPAETSAWETPRTVGHPKAKNTVQEFFSLTCTHCAAFARESFPEVRKRLIDTGKVLWVFHDFPLDRVALEAAMVARALPPDRYEPFITALFAAQDRWAFATGIDPTDELWKMAALAGMSRATFDAATNDTALRDWILSNQTQDEKRYGIDATPTFLVNGQKHAGEMSYDEFAKLIPNA